ncbi:raffinose/stachyose/melibiose transport system substrate-binding protein [Fontibacillus solani]|uniref:Raffinose/stachyose/melibiose transport system substrate-binding protein n=1 Tax=Fontibacillus solani TaxID=1572857 RepID=A0A7W3SYI5_9BACL|nr:extracellular solute-binding protein [Fontibacillus solani]MBA9088606.1 raffinose/stachyose/melibiose transport system substrate-binding protein [Fontibacillus solani]
MKWLMNWGWIVLYAFVLAISVLVIGISGSEPIEEKQSEKITLTFRHFWIKEHDRQMLNIFEDVVESFQKSHPNVKVNFEGMDQTDHRERKLKSEMVTGTSPDMFVLFGGAEIEPYVRSNRLMDLTEFVQANELEDQFQDLQLWTFDQHIYGLPIEGHAEPLYYNKTIFNNLGIEPPKSIAELDWVIKTLQKNGYIPFALGNEERWPAAIYAHYLMDRYAGPELIKELTQGEGAGNFNNSPYLAAMIKFKSWSDENAFSSPANDLSTEEAIRLFTQGKAGMYLNGNWDINLFHHGGSTDFQNEVGVIPFPALVPGGQDSIAGGYTIGIGLSSNLDETKREAALELMQAFYTEEVQSRIVYEGLRIPSMKISFDYEKTGPVFAQVVKLMEQSDDSFVAYDNVLSPEVTKTFLKVIEEMLSGTIAPDDALNQIQDTSQQYWKQRNSSLPN